MLKIALATLGLWLGAVPVATGQITPPKAPRRAADLEFMWSGAVTATTAVVKARLVRDSAVARLVASEMSDFSNPIYSSPDSAIATVNDRVVTLPVTGLQSGIRYYYALEVDGLLDTTTVGRFRTFPSDSGSFSLAMGSCALTGSNHQVFETIRIHDPLFFFHLGDFHYQNIAVNDRDLYRQAFRTQLASPRQSRLYREVPVAYIWDDHDFGPNDTDSTAPGRQAARLTYQEYAPHYPLVAGSGNVPIYQRFTVGRVLFLVCDSRSNRSPYGAIDSPTKTMLGVEQKAWLKQQLLDAQGTYPLVVWVNSLPWIGSSGEAWASYTYERRELSDFIAANQIDNLCMISGDAHMLAIDDGSHSDYSASGYPGFPVMHAAALDQTGSIKGGPYSEGTYPGGGQFGLMTVTDTGDSVVVQWSGRNYLDSELVSYRFARPIGTGTGVKERGSTIRPLEAGLWPPAPNPFNAGTVLRFEIPRSMAVNLDIFNGLGQRVRSLLAAPMAAGTYTRAWDGRDDLGRLLPSGTYHARLQADGQSISRPLILLK